MKKVFTVLGCIFAALLAIGIILAVIFVPRALRLQHAGAAYLETALPAIVGSWDANALVARATPELLATITPRADLDRLFRDFTKLGHLKHLDPATGTIVASAATGSGAATLGNFTAQADFEHGPATIRVQLKRVGDTWKINGFHVSSKAFLPR
jgi:hypothetical protein